MPTPSERPPEEYTFEIKPKDEIGKIEVWFLPSNLVLRSNGVPEDDLNALRPEHLMTFDIHNARVQIHPFFVRPDLDLNFTPKNEKLDAISFDWDEPFENISEDDIVSFLENYQPSQAFQTNPNFGLGIKQTYRRIIYAAQEHSSAKIIYIGDSEPLDGEFKIEPSDFSDMVAEVDRISSRARVAENEIKQTTCFNIMGASRGLKPRPFKLGRQQIRNLIQKYSADPDYSDPETEAELLTTVKSKAQRFAEANPKATTELINEFQVSKLEALIAEFESLMGASTNETSWQEFFEREPFALSFAFGYPVSFVNGHAYVGGRKISGEGEKIADFLYKNSLTNNAALIEIKTHKSKLLGKEYRTEVYPPSKELSGGVTQVLDQRYRLVANFAQHRTNNEWFGEHELADFEVDCVLVIGQMPTEKPQRKSFQLFRKSASHGVQIVTFDELLENLKQILEYAHDG